MVSDVNKSTILGQIFTKTAALVGSDFKQIVENFKDIDTATFSEHLKQYQIAKDYPFISDIALLEYSLHHSFQTENNTEEPLDIEAFIEALDSAPDAIKLIVNPSIRLLKSAYPIDKIFALNLEDMKEQAKIKSNKRNYHFAVLMNGEFPEILEILPATFGTVELSLLNEPLEEIYGEIFEDESPKLFEQVLREMIDNNILINFEMLEE